MKTVESLVKSLMNEIDVLAAANPSVPVNVEGLAAIRADVDRVSTMEPWEYQMLVEELLDCRNDCYPHAD